MSTFHGLEMAKRALAAQQAALYTTGHNISNAHTDGYSRQRVNFNADIAFPPGSRNSPKIAGQLGTGVDVGAIQRIRDQFLDTQFRTENSRDGYWSSQRATLSRLEDLLNEPSDSGLSKTMKQFWQSLEDLSVNPENSGARSVVKERAVAVADTFNYLSDTLKSIQADLGDEIKITAERVNVLLKDINDLNKQIKRLEPHGYLPNDLYDERDRLVDELSEMVNIKVHTSDSGGDALTIAEGVYSIELLDANGNSLGDNDEKVFLIDASVDDLDVAENEFGIIFDEDDGYGFTVADSDDSSIAYLYEFKHFKQTGTLIGLVDSYYQYEGQSETTMSIPEISEKLDKLAKEFVEAFNEQHRAGYDFDGNEGIDFFDPSGVTAGSISVAEAILKNPNKIAAAGKRGDDGEALVGDGDNALELSRVFDQSIDDLDNQSVTNFYESLIGDIGVSAEESIRRQENTATLLSQVENQRLSVSAVSLDEEMTNLIKFQHAYNAAARSMTSMDEMLDRIINNMGLVGR